MHALQQRQDGPYRMPGPRVAGKETRRGRAGHRSKCTSRRPTDALIGTSRSSHSHPGPAAARASISSVRFSSARWVYPPLVVILLTSGAKAKAKTTTREEKQQRTYGLRRRVRRAVRGGRAWGESLRWGRSTHASRVARRGALHMAGGLGSSVTQCEHSQHLSSDALGTEKSTAKVACMRDEPTISALKYARKEKRGTTVRAKKNHVDALSVNTTYASVAGGSLAVAVLRMGLRRAGACHR